MASLGALGNTSSSHLGTDTRLNGNDYRDGTETTSEGRSSARLLTPQSSNDNSWSGDRFKEKGSSDDDGENIELQHLYRRQHLRYGRRHRSSSESSALSVSSVSTESSLATLDGTAHHQDWPYSAEEEAAIVRKFDRRLVLFVAMLYMLSFLDRSNIGNARIAGMDVDLQTTPPRDDWYEWALSAFYVTYITFEWMALLWRFLPAHAYIAALVAGWGIAASLQALAGSYPWLLGMRVLLGIGEAGFAGIPLYLAQFFKREELAMRTAIFIAAAPLATTFAASLAWAILALGRHVVSPIAPWRLLFLVEGFPSVLMAAVAWRVIPDAPDKAHYLTPREKKLARLRLEENGGDSGSGSGSGSGGEDAKPATSSAPTCEAMTGNGTLSALADPAAWITAAMFFLTNMAYSSLPVFLPTILTAMGHDTVAAQALAAPPYLAAFVIVLATAHVSDRVRARAPLLIAHALASAIGYGVLSLGDGGKDSGILGRTSIMRYLAVYPAAIGFFNVVVLLISWNLNNQRGVRRQGGAFALFQVVGQCGPLVGTRLYPDSDGPLFLRGMRTMTAAMLGVALLAVVLRVVLRQRNGRLESMEAQQRAKEERVEDDDDFYEGGRGEADGLVGRRQGGGIDGKSAGRRRETAFRYML